MIERRKLRKPVAIAAKLDREQRTIALGLVLLVTGLVIGRLLLLTSP
jgi:hypothetical protein